MTCFFPLREAQGASLTWTGRFAQLRRVLAPPAADDMYALPKHMHPGGENLVSVYELLTTRGSAGNQVLLRERRPCIEMD